MTNDPSFPVTFEVEAPSRFDRIQLGLRLLVGVGLGAMHASLGGLVCTMYFFLPLTAAILITQRGGARYVSEDGPWLAALLDWVLGLYAYLLLVTDRFPLDARTRPARLRLQVSGTPSVGEAAARLVWSLPHLLVLMALGVVSVLVCFFAALSVLFRRRYPESLRSFQHHVVGYAARLLAYHASLVETYPPFSLSGSGTGSARPPTGSGSVEHTV